MSHCDAMDNSESVVGIYRSKFLLHVCAAFGNLMIGQVKDSVLPPHAAAPADMMTGRLCATVRLEGKVLGSVLIRGVQCIQVFYCC